MSSLLYDIILKTHILVGLFAMLLFWIPMFAPKGGSWHMRAGRLFVWAMLAVVFTAVLMSMMMIFIHDNGLGLFLLFLAAITLNPLLYGWWIVYTPKRTYSGRMIAVLAVISAFIIFLGGVMLWQGIRLKVDLFIYFSPVAFFLGGFMLKERVFNKPLPYLTSHLNGMIVSGGAAYTAFLAFGSRTWWPESLQSSWITIIIWISPITLSLVYSAWYRNRYGPKYAEVRIPQKSNHK